MSVIYKFLFPSKPDGTAMSLLILYLQPIITQYFASNKSEIWP